MRGERRRSPPVSADANGGGGGAIAAAGSGGGRAAVAAIRTGGVERELDCVVRAAGALGLRLVDAREPARDAAAARSLALVARASGAARAAGVLPGDLVVAVDSVACGGHAHAVAMLRAITASERECTLRVRRGSEAVRTTAAV